MTEPSRKQRSRGYGGGCFASEFWQHHDAELRRLASEGLTTTEVACRLGVTKNAVIGRAHRIGQRWARSPKPRKPTMPSQITVDPFPPSGRCVYPYGHPKADDFHFCAEQVARFGLPYCPEHMAACYQRAPAKAEREAA